MYLIFVRFDENKTTLKTEKIIFIIFLLALILKVTDTPGGNLFSIITLMPLSLLYFPFGFYFLSDKKVDNTTIAFSVISGFLLSTLVIGDLFKLMNWSGATLILVIGLISCLPIAVISYLRYSQPKNLEHVTYYKNIFIRVLVFTILGLILFIL